MRSLERSPERDAALDAMLPHVPELGWTLAALRRGLRDSGGDPLDAELLFPGGTADMVEAFIDLTDRRMAAAVADGDLAGKRLPERVRGAIAARLEMNRPNRDAIRRAFAVLANPCNAGLAARTAARTVDAIWHAAGDRSADFNWYTKRASLGAVYTATMLYWLRDSGEDDSATLAFLDRRLAGVQRAHKARKRLTDALMRWLPGEAAA